MLGLSLITLGGIIGFGYFSIKNIRKSEEFIKKGLDNTKKGLDNIIDDFNKGIKIEKIEGHNGEILNGKEAYKYLIENMLEKIYANPVEIEDYVNKMNLSEIEKVELIKHLKTSMNQATEKVNSAIGISFGLED